MLSTVLFAAVRPSGRRSSSALSTSTSRRSSYPDTSRRLSVFTSTPCCTLACGSSLKTASSVGPTRRPCRHSSDTARVARVRRPRARQVRSCVRRFLQHLRRRGVVQGAASRPERARLVVDFLHWMKVHRGVAETALTSYGSYVEALVGCLGSDPQSYTARALREFIEVRYRHFRSTSLRMVMAAVRMFLRYLAAEGICRPGLEHALTPLANWSQQSLPQGLTAEDVQRVLDACPQTPQGIRDRAALLLMVRLGLRAGDVSKLRFADVRFETATIRVSGKGGREVELPLPQDVGDALLEYLRDARPRVHSEFVFLRSIAPFQPFSVRTRMSV